MKQGFVLTYLINLIDLTSSHYQPYVAHNSKEFVSFLPPKKKNPEVGFWFRKGKLS